MPSSRLLALLGALGLSAGAAVELAGTGAASADPAYTVQTLHFATHVGPAGVTNCDVVGDLYTPTSATPTTRVPAILTTNGFGGSKDDQAGIGKAVPDVTTMVKVTLPGIVHQFAAGHTIRLVVAGGSDNHRGGLTAAPVAIASGTGQTLILPTVS